MRFAPRSLYGRLALVLFSGLLVAQLLSAAINFAERDNILFRTTGLQTAQRIADIANLLDSLAGTERRRIAAILNVPPLSVNLELAPNDADALFAGTPHALMFSTVLRATLGSDRPFRVIAVGSVAGAHPAAGIGHREAMAFGRMPFANMHQFPPPGLRFGIQVRLHDGTWVTFNTEFPRETAGMPLRLILTLVVLLAAVLLLSLLAVRWVTRPLNVLASAAEALGNDIHRAPLPEQGPIEVQRAAHAFNIMQTRLVRFIDDRTRLLTAMSHDLKTPITRMRLRAELLEDDEQRRRFEKDLKEMESMVAQTLDFMRGLGSEARQPIDLMALIGSLQADHAEMGRTVTIEGNAAAPITGMPLALKRCLGNLLDNAALYGGTAHLVVEDGADAITLRIRDDGPGIPDDELERVFEPFHRLETSRNRATGGTGLGLGIARDIARAHGGDVYLRNLPSGGLEAVLTLSRC